MRTLSLLAASALVLASVPARAEVPEFEPYIGLTGGATLPTRSWDLGTNVVRGQLEPTNSMQFGLRLGFQLTSQLAFEVGAQYLALQALENRGNGGMVYHGDVLFHFLKGDFSPFIIGGAGAYHSLENPLGEDVDYQIHLGLGVRAMVNDWLAVRLELRDVVTDGFGDSNAIAGNNLELSFGVDLFPMKAAEPKDTDKDGIIDLNDKCIEVKGVESAQGCPDADGDGITDADDACPNEPGAPEHRGCPDRDGDAIIDREDKCPDVPGVAALAGCPDRDGDGITDAADVCPDQAGPKNLKGCPDRDGDGLADKDDACPDVKGLKKFKGCPDTDGDGLTDAEDACPTEPGKKEASRAARTRTATAWPTRTTSAPRCAASRRWKAASRRKPRSSPAPSRASTSSTTRPACCRRPTRCWTRRWPSSSSSPACASASRDTPTTRATRRSTRSSRRSAPSPS
ncbi:MAG: thrombospondin type 3 repeat-containing protein [Myxococcales bacterium]